MIKRMVPTKDEFLKWIKEDNRQYGKEEEAWNKKHQEAYDRIQAAIIRMEEAEQALAGKEAKVKELREEIEREISNKI